MSRVGVGVVVVFVLVRRRSSIYRADKRALVGDSVLDEHAPVVVLSPTVASHSAVDCRGMTDSDYCESLPPWRLVSVIRASEPSGFDAVHRTIHSNHYEPPTRVVAEVREFCESLGADPRKVHPSRLGHLFDSDPSVDEIGVALDELAAERNGQARPQP